MIQPFDGGKFDNRYADIFAPAILDAGLEPYRVDNDPSVTVPIDDIEKGIRRADVCLADITLNNPNVWCEVGMAIASEKEICLVCCSKERQENYPFDVQHRTIIPYQLESKADFASLQSKITKRIQAIMEKSQKLAVLEARSPIKESEGLLQHEIIVLVSIIENRQGPADNVSHWTLREELARLGYNNLAVNIGVDRLVRRGMIDVVGEQDNNYNTYTAYSVQSEGMKWVAQNYERLNLKIASGPAKQAASRPPVNDLDDDIPF